VRSCKKWFLVLFIVFSWLGSEAWAEVAKRETRTLVLDNGMQVLLMHDRDVDHSAAAVSVGVGSLYDPKDKMGLAHYLEHMLFLGTEKFPKVGSFKDYLNSNSGRSNAYTADDITNYFLQVRHEAFEGAMERFSDFFRAPLFDKKYAEREVNAVNSEFDKNKLQDGWRANYVEDLVSEKGHPIQKFSIGNKETLAGDNRPALLAFHKKYYAASNMRLVMLSSASMDQMEQYAKKYFSPIRDFEVKKEYIDPVFRKPLQNKYRLLKIKTIKDTRTLSLEFPTIRLHDHLKSKPASIVGSVMGYEGKGSLLSKLKEEGLVLGLSAGGGYSHKNINAFSINVSLTQKGLQEYERVLEIVFAYIEMIRDQGFKEYTFRENQSMAQINFDWKSPQEGMGYVSGIASLMQKYPLKDVETLPYLFFEYDPKTYQSIMETLRPENMLAVLKSQNVSTDKVEHFFGTEYSLTTVGGEGFNRLKHPPRISGMTYPMKNDFIPDHLVLHDEEPVVVRDDKLARVWYQYDSKFKQPKVYIKYLIETPRVYDSPDNLAKSKLYDAALHEGLNELTYPISLAGLSYGLGIEKRGMVLSVGGYSERITDLVKLVAKNLTRVTISEQKFQDMKEAMIRGLKNKKLGQGYARAAYYNRHIWVLNQFTEEQVLAALEKVTLADIKEYARHLYERVYIRGLVHGNVTSKKALESLDILLSQIKSQALPENERYTETINKLDPNEKIRFSQKVADNNNALYYSLQIGDKGFKRQALASMVASVVESDFYTQMRTNQQLGYIVWSFTNRSEDRLFFKMIIQSGTYGPFELQRRVEKWMQGSQSLFANLTEEEFEKYRKSLIISLQRKGDSIAEVASELYHLAIEEKGDFQYKDKMVEAVKNLTREEVIEAGRMIFQNADIPRSVLLIRSRTNEDVVPEGVITNLDSIKNRHSRQASLTQ